MAPELDFGKRWVLWLGSSRETHSVERWTVRKTRSDIVEGRLAGYECVLTRQMIQHVRGGQGRKLWKNPGRVLCYLFHNLSSPAC